MLGCFVFGTTFARPIRYKQCMTNLFAKIAVWGVALAALLYVAVCALMYFQQRRLMYFPQFTRVEAAQTNFALQRDGLTLRGWQQHPGAAAAPAGEALIYLGGNAERVEQALPLLHQWLPTHSIYSLAYRGYGASEGQPTEAALEQDALALYDAVQQLHPQGRITVMGRSLGTGVAAAVAAQRQPARTALITPFDNMVDTVRDHYGWLPVRWLLRDRYPSDTRLAQYQGAVLVLRAGLDTLVLPARTDALERTLAARHGAVLQVQHFPQADHISILQGEGMGATLAQFAQGQP